MIIKDTFLRGKKGEAYFALDVTEKARRLSGLTQGERIPVHGIGANFSTEAFFLKYKTLLFSFLKHRFHVTCFHFSV